MTVDAARWQRHPHALWRRSSDRVLVLPDGADDALLLDGAAAILWLLLDRPVTFDEIVACFAPDAANDTHDLHADVRELCRELEQANVLTLTGQP
ncbi:MAG: PqqD family protein [Nitriliruptoraceae bacterium]|nr:PqqD family protein [Nitriliruptoraceae bacterium]